MQTFITDFNMAQNAKNLDNKRCGKQRVEGIQIANCLLVQESRWKNHPAVKMWKGYEKYLIHEYLHTIIIEWQSRGFKNDKCWIHFRNLSTLVIRKELIKPPWITSEFIESHRSNLIRKNPDFYKPLFPNTQEGLEYIWPTNNNLFNKDLSKPESIYNIEI